MDSSVCLKRKECATEPEFVVPVHLSRQRSNSEDFRKKRRGTTGSPSLLGAYILVFRRFLFPVPAKRKFFPSV